MSNMRDKAEANRKQRINNARYRMENAIRAANNGNIPCPVCGEPMIKPASRCGFCREEEEGLEPVA